MRDVREYFVFGYVFLEDIIDAVEVFSGHLPIDAFGSGKSIGIVILESMRFFRGRLPNLPQR